MTIKKKLNTKIPLKEFRGDDESKSQWETIVDFTKETGGGMSIDELLASIKLHK